MDNAQPKNVEVKSYISENLFRKVHAEANSKGFTISGYIRFLLTIDTANSQEAFYQRGLETK